MGEDNCHDAGQIRLNHKIANFSFQVEVRCHYYIFSCRRQKKEEKGERKTKEKDREREEEREGGKCIINEVHVMSRQHRHTAEIFRTLFMKVNMERTENSTQ